MSENASATKQVGPYIIWIYDSLTTWIQADNLPALNWHGPDVNIYSTDLESADFETLIRKYRKTVSGITDINPDTAYQYGMLVGGALPYSSQESMDKLFVIDFLPHNASSAVQEEFYPAFLQGIHAMRTHQATHTDE